jgi:uncharacterized protein (DUF3820 family)
MRVYAQGHVSDKGKNHDAHSDEPTLSLRNLPEVAFTAVEQKLLRLACDRAATEHEADVCGIKLVRSWRRRGVDAERIIGQFCVATQMSRDLMAARGYVVNFGKYRGRTVGECPPNYLRWALRECDNLSFNLRRAMRLVLAQGSK